MMLETPQATDHDVEYIDEGLWPWQMHALFDTDPYGFVALIGGRGSGKSHLDGPEVARWLDLPKDLYFGICAPEDKMLQTALAEIGKTISRLGYEHTYGPRAPREWRERWDASGVIYPPPRFRNDHFWIIEDGTHIFTFSLVNKAYTRVKGLNMNVIKGVEMTEPGVDDNAITTMIGCLRCGRATRQRDGSYRCVVPGHLHQLRIAANVPLNDPSHFMRAKIRKMYEAESARRATGKPRYFCLIQSKTTDNKATGDSYVEMLREAWDEETFEEQTSGDILHTRRSRGLIYHAFSELNILPVTYDPYRPLHIWFDWNAVPATAGWGHDLRYDEVPPAFLSHRADAWYFGVNGELHSGSDPMQTHQVAEALLYDPSDDARVQEAPCVDCGHPLSKHGAMPPRGLYCRACAFEAPAADRKGNVFCSGAVQQFNQEKSYIHAANGWRGLIKHRGMIYVYGDASGTATHADAIQTGGSIKIIQDYFDEALGERVVYRWKRGNPPINLRLLAVNRSLESRSGVRSLYFAPHCTAHIDDCRMVVPDKDGKPLKKSRPSKPTSDTYWQRTHSMDGCGYFVDWRAPFDTPRHGLPHMADAGDYAQMGAMLPSP